MNSLAFYLPHSVQPLKEHGRRLRRGIGVSPQSEHVSKRAPLFLHQQLKPFQGTVVWVQDQLQSGTRRQDSPHIHAHKSSSDMQGTVVWVLILQDEIDGKKKVQTNPSRVRSCMRIQDQLRLRTRRQVRHAYIFRQTRKGTVVRVQRRLQSRTHGHLHLLTCASPVSWEVLSQPSEQCTSTATPLCSSSATNAAPFIICTGRTRSHQAEKRNHQRTGKGIRTTKKNKVGHKYGAQYA